MSDLDAHLGEEAEAATAEETTVEEREEAATDKEDTNPPLQLKDFQPFSSNQTN